MLSRGEIAVTLRALQALGDARIDVLRCLTERRMTSAEVAVKLRMRKSSAHKHLTRLARAGFVLRHDDDDRVWVYYSLTRQGRHLVQSERPRLVLLLGTALLLLAGSLAYVAWKVHAWRNIDGDGTWGVDEIFPRPRPEFFTVGVVLAILLAVLALLAAGRVGWRLTSSREADAEPST